MKAVKYWTKTISGWPRSRDLEQKATWGNFLLFLKKSLVSGRGMQRSWLPVVPLFFVHFSSMFPEVFVALNVQLYEVADFDRVDFSGAAVADLRQRHSVIKQPVSIQNILLMAFHHRW